MTSYSSELVIGSAIVFAALGAAYILRPSPSPLALQMEDYHRPSPSPLALQMEDYHRQYWGKPLDSALTTLPTPADDLELDDDETPSSGVLPGEPFLDIFETPLLVRVEYIRAFDAVRALYETSHRTHLAVLTGQPGIGKTFWIHYALRRCLGEKQAVVWYRSKRFVLFSSTGVAIYDHVDSIPRQDPYTWCFVDSAHADPLPSGIFERLSHLFPIYVTSPKEERWAKLHQLRIPRLFIMNPWTMVELQKAVVLYPKQKPEEIPNRFDKAGPTARLCLQYTDDELEAFYNKQSKISFSTPERFVTALLNNKDDLLIGDISHQICVVRRSDSKASSFIVGPISAFIRDQLLTQLGKWNAERRIEMIKRFSRVPGAGGMVGVLFESHYQHEFAKEINIVAVPMFRASQPRSRWHAQFGNFSTSSTLQKAQQEASSTGHSLTLSVSPSRLQMYEPSGQLTVEENVYYVPLSEIQVAIDSFIVHAGHLYLFQFASGQQHDVNRGLLATLARFSGLPGAENRYFIFVVPKRLTRFDCPHSDNGFLHNHVPYVAQVDSLTEMA